jgi:hypothetical protein
MITRKLLLAAFVPTVLFTMAPPARAGGGGDAAEIRSVARSFVAALYDGNLARAERQAYAGNRERDVIEAMSLTLSSDAKLSAALDERFGWCKEGEPCTLANAAATLAKAEVSIDGATARIGNTGRTTLPMRWTGDGWKVDVIALARQRGAGRELLPRACQRAAEVDQLISEIESGEYLTVADVLDRTQQREATASIQD